MRGVPYSHSAEAYRRAFSEEPRSDELLREESKVVGQR